MKSATYMIGKVRKAGYTMQKIAAEVGVSQMTIYRWAKEAPKSINLEKLNRLEKLFIKACGNGKSRRAA